ncbi:MAG: DMT family transporter [Geminicoccaceae bacterium]|nr:MAG: DMT family transporter [Geminicoccaceae bacterium]
MSDTTLDKASATNAGAHLRLLLTMFLWGQMIPGFVVLLEVWDPFALSAARYVIAAPLMLAFLAWWAGRITPPLRSEWGKLALLGLFGMGGLITFYTVGLAHANPITAIVVQTASPLTHTAIAVLFYKERVPQGLGTSLALVVPGGLLLAAPAFAGGEMAFRGGEVLLLAGSICWAWYSLQCPRWLPDYGEVRLTTWTMIAATPCLVVLFLALWSVGLTAPPAAWPPLELNLLMLWLILSSTCLGIILWHGAVGRLGLATSALYFNVAPLFALVITSLLGFVPTLTQLAGGALVLLGVGQLQARRWWAARQRLTPTASS